MDTPGLGSCQHLLGRYLQNAVHPRGGQHDAAGERDGARAQVGAGAARDDRDTVIGSQPQDPCDLLGVRWRDDSIRHPTEQRCRVARVHDKLAICQPEVLRSSDGAQLGQNGPRNTGFTRHYQTSKHSDMTLSIGHGFRA